VIPSNELEIYLSTFEVAFRLALAKRAPDGYGELSYAMERARAALDAGEEWDPELLNRYRRGLANYAAATRSGPVLMDSR